MFTQTLRFLFFTTIKIIYQLKLLFRNHPEERKQDLLLTCGDLLIRFRDYLWDVRDPCYIPFPISMESFTLILILKTERKYIILKDCDTQLQLSTIE